MKQEIRDEFNQAVALRDAGDLAAARLKLETLSERDPESAALWATLGLVLWDMKQLEEAVSVFRKAVLLKPTMEAVSLGLFHCLWQLNRRVEALDEVKRFMTVSDSQDYRDIVRGINEKYED